MVKNKTGGNKAKKYARKYSNQETTNIRVRFIEDDGELYGIITKHFGQGQVEVLCHDGHTRHGIIRKKFRGRHKHDNKISIGVWVMVGLRDWQRRAGDKKELCDILEIYNADEKEKLVQQTKHNVSMLLNEESSLANVNGASDSVTNDIIFENKDTADNACQKNEMNDENIETTDDSKLWDEVDFDDI